MNLKKSQDDRCVDGNAKNTRQFGAFFVDAKCTKKSKTIPGILLVLLMALFGELYLHLANIVI